MDSPVRLGVSPTAATAVVHSHLWVSVSHSVSPTYMICHLEVFFQLDPMQSTASPWVLNGLVALVDFFFNSLVVGVPCSLIFWHFWLFIDFRLVVILLLVVWGSKGFLPTPPSWPELGYILTTMRIQKKVVTLDGKVTLLHFSIQKHYALFLILVNYI